jgi:hypothetical protein
MIISAWILSFINLTYIHLHLQFIPEEKPLPIIYLIQAGRSDITGCRDKSCIILIKMNQTFAETDV